MLNTNSMLKNSTPPAFLKELSDKDIKDIQQTILDMIELLSVFFEENNIQYYLGGGSALGATRHKGFIPWDEDLDLNMPRKDYDKFIRLFQDSNYLKSKFYLCEHSVDKNFDVNFMKIKLKGTKYTEYLYKDYNKDGIFIDVFPVENTYNNAVLRKIHGLVSEMLLLITSCKRILKKRKSYLELNNEKKYKRVINIKCIIGVIFSFFTLNMWLFITDKVLKICKNSNSKYITVPPGRKHFFGEVIERKEVEPFVKSKFEHLELYVAQNNKYYLNQLFGDFMKIPNNADKERHFIYDFSLR